MQMTGVVREGALGLAGDFKAPAQDSARPLMDSRVPNPTFATLHQFPTTWDGIWWALVTVTTVGYGDIAPKSVGGQVVAVFVMLFGIAFLSVLTATIATRFVNAEKSDEGGEILAALTRLETELAELKRRLGPP